MQVDTVDYVTLQSSYMVCTYLICVMFVIFKI
jgi:hypothetical protein